MNKSKVNKNIPVDFGDPKKRSRDPQKGRDPQFENRCLNRINFDQ